MAHHFKPTGVLVCVNTEKTGADESCRAFLRVLLAELFVSPLLDEHEYPRQDFSVISWTDKLWEA